MKTFHDTWLLFMRSIRLTLRNPAGPFWVCSTAVLYVLVRTTIEAAQQRAGLPTRWRFDGFYARHSRNDGNIQHGF